MNNDKKTITITDIYWENIYLHFILDMKNIDIEDCSFYIINFKGEKYPLEAKENHIVINIVNFPNDLLLHNGKWHFSYEFNGEENIIMISNDCGYLLANMDKVFRYGAKNYAYIITFDAEDYLTCQNKLCNIYSIDTIDNENKYELTLSMHTSYMMKNKRNWHRNIFVESQSISKLIRKSLFIILKQCINMAYNVLYKFSKRNGKHILLMSETRTPISGNLKALDDRIKQRKIDKNIKVSYSFYKTLQQSKFKTLIEWTRLLWIIPKQDYIFIDDYVPIFKTIKLKQENKLIQLWHAGVGFKSVGYSRFGKNGSPLPTDSCHRQYSYAVVGSKDLVHVYEEVFGIPKDRFLPFGLPRLDGYLNEDRIENYKHNFYHKFPNIKNKKVILFAPTYRGATQKQAYYPLDLIDQDRLYDVLDDDYVFAFKMHPFITQQIEIKEEYQDKIYDFTKEPDINELFYITEVLITDFSSNMYEFSLFHKPMIFFVFDKDYYQLTRGVHHKIDGAPGVLCESFDDLIKLLKSKEYYKSTDKIKKFVDKFFPEDKKAYASDLIIDELILNKNKQHK